MVMSAEHKAKIAEGVKKAYERRDNPGGSKEGPAPKVPGLVSTEAQQFERVRKEQEGSPLFNVYTREGGRWVLVGQHDTADMLSIAETFGGGLWQLRWVDQGTLEEVDARIKRPITYPISEIRYGINPEYRDPRKKISTITSLDDLGSDDPADERAFSKEEVQKLILDERTSWQKEQETKAEIKGLTDKLNDISSKLANPAVPQVAREDLGTKAIDIALKIAELTNAAKGPAISPVGVNQIIPQQKDIVDTLTKVSGSIASIVTPILGVWDLIRQKMTVEKAAASGSGLSTMLAVFAPLLTEIIKRQTQKLPIMEPALERAEEAPASQLGQPIQPEPSPQAAPVQPRQSAQVEEENREKKYREEAMFLESYVSGFKELKARILGDMRKREAPLETAKWVKDRFSRETPIGEFISKFTEPDQFVSVITSYYPDETVKYGTEAEKAVCEKNAEWLFKLADELVSKAVKR